MRFMEFKNKTVIITGGANGIGEATANAFYDAGANVAILDLQDDKKDLNDLRWFYKQCDVSKSNDVIAAMNAIYEKFGAIHFLINNAGIQRYGTVSEATE